MRGDQSARRVAALRGRLVDLELDGAVITTPENIRYLSGFSGSLGYLVIGRTDAEILGDSRYWLQMEAEAPGFTLVRCGPSHGLWALVAQRLKALELRRVGFESQHLTFDQHQRLSAALPGEHTLVAVTGLVEELRIVKAPEEVELLRAVSAIAGRAFDRVRGAIRRGARRREPRLRARPGARHRIAGTRASLPVAHRPHAAAGRDGDHQRARDLHSGLGWRPARGNGAHHRDRPGGADCSLLGDR